MKEHDFEPVPGLPGPLPAGETLLWQGGPRWTALARHALHVRAIAVYFAVLLVWREATLFSEGAGALPVVRAALLPALLAGAAIGVFSLLAWLMARGTVYTITSRRVVIRFGLVLPGMVNLPFRVVDAAAVRRHADGTGDIPLTLVAGTRVGWLVMWPHVRPARFAHPQPMLRCVAQPDHVARILGRALAAHAAQPIPVAVRKTGAAAPEPVTVPA
ncbi:MAG: PH domain-containing protein [Acetobacteraceae bacterium]|nr:PH domain-containing protein [Acetobacteraceae bacterium]